MGKSSNLLFPVHIVGFFNPENIDAGDAASVSPFGAQSSIANPISTKEFAIAGVRTVVIPTRQHIHIISIAPQKVENTKNEWNDNCIWSTTPHIDTFNKFSSVVLAPDTSRVRSTCH